MPIEVLGVFDGDMSELGVVVVVVLVLELSVPDAPPTAPEICGALELSDCEVPDCEVPDCEDPDCEDPGWLVSDEVLGVVFEVDVSVDVPFSVVDWRDEDDVPLIGSGDGVVCAIVEAATSNAEPNTSKGDFLIVLLLHYEK